MCVCMYVCIYIYVYIDVCFFWALGSGPWFSKGGRDHVVSIPVRRRGGAAVAVNNHNDDSNNNDNDKNEDNNDNNDNNDNDNNNNDNDNNDNYYYNDNNNNNNNNNGCTVYPRPPTKRVLSPTGTWLVVLLREVSGRVCIAKFLEACFPGGLGTH